MGAVLGSGAACVLFASFPTGAVQSPLPRTNSQSPELASGNIRV